MVTRDVTNLVRWTVSVMTARAGPLVVFAANRSLLDMNRPVMLRSRLPWPMMLLCGPLDTWPAFRPRADGQGGAGSACAVFIVLQTVVFPVQVRPCTVTLPGRLLQRILGIGRFTVLPMVRPSAIWPALRGTLLFMTYRLVTPLQSLSVAANLCFYLLGLRNVVTNGSFRSSALSLHLLMNLCEGLRCVLLCTTFVTAALCYTCIGPLNMLQIELATRCTQPCLIRFESPVSLLGNTDEVDRSSSCGSLTEPLVM